MSPEYSRTCGRVLAAPELDGATFDRLREEYLRCDSADELGPEARLWYDRFLVATT